MNGQFILNDNDNNNDNDADSDEVMGKMIYICVVACSLPNSNVKFL